MVDPVTTNFADVRTILSWAERAMKHGLQPSDLQPSIDESERMQRLVYYVTAGCPPLGTGIAYNAATVGRILGLPVDDCSDSPPKAEDGEIVVYYNGWSLGDLVGTGKVVNHLSFERETWKAEPGYYRVLLPVPNSNRQKWAQQAGDKETSLLARLYVEWQAIPTPIGATALAVHLGVSGEDLLNGDFARCAEALPGGRRAALSVHEGRVRVGRHWDGGSHDRIFLGAARKC